MASWSGRPRSALTCALTCALLLLAETHADEVDNIFHPLQSEEAGHVIQNVGPAYIVDLSSQDPHGQIPPSSTPIDLGPQRPHGQIPPSSTPIDLGPQRPHGQIPPSSTPIDLGPQRPHGQIPPSSTPIDLGPQRPHGQIPPSSTPIDLGPQRPHGQIPPSSTPFDLGPQRPHGQIPPSSTPIDLGPQRPHGQIPPSSTPIDLGPQRPHGQIPPSSTPFDLGPQRPHGQIPPSSTPIDLGPQRPHGQIPPSSTPFDLGPQRGQVLADQVSVQVLENRRPMDVGPRRPAGLVDPNGPPAVDLEPLSSSGTAVPYETVAVDLGPRRPAGSLDPNGPRGSNGDLGPHRPQGLTDPNLPPVQDDDQADNRFHVYWNVPSFMCHRYELPFSNLTSRYGIVQNDGDLFRGHRITILYDPGLYPALVDNDGKIFPRNGGVPQEGNLELHLNRLERAIEDQVPQNIDGLGVIDFEAWRPTWAQNFGTLKAYQTYSVQIERQRSPKASESTLLARAKQRFEAAAREFFLESLKLAKRLRPRARWGYYAFPYCFNSNANNFDCSDNVRSQNSQIQWLFDASTALYPSVYLSKSGRSANDELLFVSSRLREAARVARGRHIVYPYLWYRYRDAGFLSDDDLRTCLALPRSMRLAGAIVWGSSADMNTRAKCQALDAHLNTRLGPTIRKFSVVLSDRSVRDYMQQRNTSATASSDEGERLANLEFDF